MNLGAVMEGIDQRNGVNGVQATPLLGFQREIEVSCETTPDAFSTDSAFVEHEQGAEIVPLGRMVAGVKKAG
jgi:hypothetical protein